MPWSTDDETEHAVESVKGPKILEWMRAGKRFRMKPMDSIRGTVNVVLDNLGFELFLSRLYRTQHRFYINQLFKGGGDEAVYDSDIDK